ncbi:MAG TPA: hypothetical protein VHZ02_02055 [Acidimicrobiales bacterium]|jgi:hypothetical protein|nr:hypothetical protein [Acidimicrobiales bacterium]
MEQPQLPLIETTAPAPTDNDGARPGAATTATRSSTPGSGQVSTSGRTSGRKGRRAAGSTRPANGSPESDWRLDEHTRAVGREGVAAARALLDRANRAA